MTTTRNDVHAPKNLVTEDYEYLYAGDNQQPGRLINVDLDWWASITNFEPALRDRGISQCHHCGAHVRYFALLRHVPSGFAITVGETCLDNRFERATADFQRLRKDAALDRQAQRIKTAAAAFVAGLEGDTALALDRETDLVQAFGFDPQGYACRTILDIRRKVWDRYGDASERQVAFVAKLISENRGEVAKRAAAQAERDAEVKAPAPQGRLAFEGVVVSRKGHDSEWGFSFKLTVKVTNEDGTVWLAWITEPAKAPETARGDRIRVTATLTRSDRDEAFAFGKRPHGLEIIERPTEVPEVDALAD